MGAELKIGRGSLPLQAHDTHAHFFLPINFSANSAPQLILRFYWLSITVLINFLLHYATKNANP